MKTKFEFRTFAALGCATALLALTAGCAGSRHQGDSGEYQYKRSTGEYIDDKAIGAKVKAALIDDERVKASDVTVKAYAGVVQLGWFVDTEEQRSAAEIVAQNVAGVKSVENKISLKPAPESARRTEAAPQQERSADRSITRSELDAEVKADYSLQKASTLIGMKVKNTSEEKLGDIKDLAIDLQSGDLSYAIIASGGLFGVGEKLHVVPPGVLQFSQSDRNVQLNISKERWKSSPVFEKEQLVEFEKETEVDRVYKYYELELPKNRDITIRTEERLSPTGKELVSGRLQYASSLIGRELVNRQQEKIGKITDLLVNFEGHPTVAIINTTRYLGDKDGTYVVSVNALSLSGKQQAILDAPRPLFEQAGEFNLSAHARSPGDPGKTMVFRFDERTLREDLRSPASTNPADRDLNPDKPGKQ